VGDL
jgi:hypothetical protein